MLNSTIINSVCSYLTNKDIIQFHKITLFYPDIRLWNERIVEDWNINENEFAYLFNNFHIKCLKLRKNHPNCFYDKLCDMRVIEVNRDSRDLIPFLDGIVQRSKRIRRLDLGLARISNIEFLSSCSALEYLNLFHTAIHDLGPLSSCSMLEDLCLSETRVSDLRPLSSCLALKRLNLYNTRVYDLVPLSLCSKLEELNLGASQNSVIQSLPPCLSLKRLILANTQIFNLELLLIHPMLEDLDLYCSTQVSDLEILFSCQTLKKLYLNHITSEDIISKLQEKGIQVILI
jgi:internalin A